VGDAGVAIKTLDAGAHWFSLTSPGNLDLVDVDFLGASGIVCGGFDVIRTDDGGTTWFPLTRPGVGPIHACELLNPSTILAAGHLLVRSTDGGMNWEGLVLGGPEGSLSFVDPNNGAFASSHVIYVTSDGGVSWTERGIGPGESETSMSLTDLAFRDPGLIAFSAFATTCDIINPYDCSSHGEAQFSTNGGLWWTIDEVFPSELFGVSANDSGVMLFVGLRGVIARRHPPDPIHVVNNRRAANGGAYTFVSLQRALVASYVHETNFFGQTRTIYSRFLTTIDSGDSWNESFKNNSLVNDVAFAPTDDPLPPAYAIGSSFNPATEAWSAQVLKSIDGGASWSSLWTSGAHGMLYAMDFPTQIRLVAVGDAGTIVIVENDVVTPSNVQSGDLRGISFATEMVGVAVGFSGNAPTMLRTTDGGTQWSPVDVGISQRLYKVEFATEMIGVAIGSGGAIVRTTDGGETWDPVASPTAADLNALAFWNASRGFIASDGGRVLETFDGGATWSTVASPTTIDLTDVGALGEGHAVFVGPDQTILDYQITPVPTLITSFTGASGTFSVGLSWTVRNDVDLAEFRIERRDDGSSRRFDNVAAAARSYRDDTVIPGSKYEYVLVAIDSDGTETYSPPIRVVTDEAELALLPNVPNPFNPSTRIRYVLPTRANVRVTIYDVAGRPVATLVDREQAPGQYDVEWNGTDAGGSRVASGIYLARIEAGKRALSRKMVLLK
jgi:photosystem II stability/assembly factor-like uncharacterized protein